MQISIIPPRISLLIFICRLAFIPMYRPTMLNSVEHKPMTADAERTALSTMPCKQAKEMPTAKASMLVAIDKVVILSGLSVFNFSSFLFLHPSHIIFIPS